MGLKMCACERPPYRHVRRVQGLQFLGAAVDFAAGRLEGLVRQLRPQLMAPLMHWGMAAGTTVEVRG